jgi:hypothetical protein
MALLALVWIIPYLPFGKWCAGTTIFFYRISVIQPTFSCIHIDNYASQANSFLKWAGFVPCIAACEMELCI